MVHQVPHPIKQHQVKNGSLAMMAASAVRREEGDNEEEEEEEAEGGGGGQELPNGWKRVIEQPLHKSYLLSPSVNSEGKAVKPVKVFSRKLHELQAPSSRFPHGRFHEIEEQHFSWVRKRVQLQVGIVQMIKYCIYFKLSIACFTRFKYISVYFEIPC